jgi:hypothetical protein
LALLLACPCAARADAKFQPSSDKPEPRETAQPKEKIAAHRPPPPAYSKYRDQFDAICSGLDRDGRRDPFGEMLLAGAVRDLECPACKPFFTAFAEGCKIRKPSAITSHVKASPTPTQPPKVKEREPNVTLIADLNELFQALADDEKHRPEHYRAVSKFVAFLGNGDGRTPAANEYFGIVAQIAAAPFADYKKELERAVREEKVKERTNLPPLNLDDFFGE